MTDCGPWQRLDGENVPPRDLSLDRQLHKVQDLQRDLRLYGQRLWDLLEELFSKRKLCLKNSQDNLQVLLKSFIDLGPAILGEAFLDPKTLVYLKDIEKEWKAISGKHGKNKEDTFVTPMAIFLGYALPITLGVAGGVGAKKFKFFVDQKVPNPVLRGSLKVGVGAVGIGGLSVLFYFLGQNQKSLGYTSQHILDGLYLSSCVDMNIFLGLSLAVRDR